MRVISVFVAVLAVAIAAPSPQAPPAPAQSTHSGGSGGDNEATIVRYDSENTGIDGYKYSVETSNGITAEEEGQLQNAGSENEAISVRGSFSWTAPDGKTYTVTYIADENGFQPQGEHIPEVPKIATDQEAPQGRQANPPPAQSRQPPQPVAAAAPQQPPQGEPQTE